MREARGEGLRLSPDGLRELDVVALMGLRARIADCLPEGCPAGDAIDIHIQEQDDMYKAIYPGILTYRGSKKLGVLRNGEC